MFDFYAHKQYMQEIAKKNEEVRSQLQAQQEREEREKLLLEEKQQEVRKLTVWKLADHITFVRS